MLCSLSCRAPDRRYVILHETMHHQLDELGCPSLCCSLAGKEPAGSWLLHTAFPKFVRGLLVQLWELIQHSRFNPMLLRVFDCGPQSARNVEYESYISNKRIPLYGMCGPDGHPSLHRVLVAAHIATVSLEGSADVRDKFISFVRERFQIGEAMVRRSVTILCTLEFSAQLYCRTILCMVMELAPSMEQA